MSEMNRYLSILIDALNKKDNILDQIGNCVGEQETCLAKTDFTLEEYNQIMEKKGRLIADMNKLDDGFTAVYARISPAIKADPLAYKSQLKTIQDLVAKVSDKTALIQARELRLRNMIDRMVKESKPASGNFTVSKNVAADRYKKVMNRTVVTPRSIFMDKKN